MRTGWPRICALTLALSAPVLASASKATLGVDFLQPEAWSLQSTAPMEFYARIECGATDSWLLMDDLEGGTVLASGVGPQDGTQAIFQGAFQQGLRRFRLDLVADGEVLSRRLNFAVAAPQLQGWPWQPNSGSKQSTLPLQPELIGENLVFPVRSMNDSLVMVDRVYSFLPDGSLNAGYPLELSAQGESLEICSLPLAVSADESAFLLQCKSGLVIHQGAVRLQHPATGWVSTPPISYATAEGVRFYSISGDENQRLLQEFNSELVLLRSCALPEGTPISGQPLVLADLESDGQSDLVLALNDAVTPSCTLYRIGLQDFTCTPMFSVEMLLKGVMAGELNNDWFSDLVLIGYTSVLVVDPSGTELAQCSGLYKTGPATLVGGATGHSQRVLFTEVNLVDECYLRVLRSDGVVDPLDGILLGTHMECHHGPMYADVDGDGRREILLALEDQTTADSFTRVAVVDPVDGLQDSEWFMPGCCLKAPLLCDLNHDGLLDFVLADDRGTLAVWPTLADEANPPHALGNSRHNGSWLQVTEQSSLPEVLEGSWAWSGVRALCDGGLCRNFTLLAGELSLAQNHQLEGALSIGGDATLRVYNSAELSLPAGIALDVAGTLCLQGTGYQLGQLPSGTTRLASALNAMNLQFRAGATFRSQDCILVGLERDIVLENANLQLVQTWLEGESHIQLRGTQAFIQHSLLQLRRDMVDAREGSRLTIETSVLTCGEGVAVSSRDGALQLSECTLLTSDCGVETGGSGSVLLIGCHFQGNDVDLRVLDHAAQISMRDCDFIEAFDVAVDNRDLEDSVMASQCYWQCEVPSSGNVQRLSPLEEPHQLLAVPSTVSDVGTGPMVDGDEPLEWDPVNFSVGGIPLRVSYRVYRSSDAYDVVSPENLLAEVTVPFYHDRQRPPRAFYCVTAVVGYVSDEAQGQGN